MASISSIVSASTVVSEFKYDEEEFGELIGLIAREVEKLAADDADFLRDHVASYGNTSGLNALAALCAAAAKEAR